MKRRAVLMGMLGAVALPLLADAQSKIPVIGFLVPGNLDPTSLIAAFKEALGRIGYIDGRNLRIEFRAGDGSAASLARLASELVSLKVDIIVTWLTPSVRAAKQATSDIPIVMAGAGDPVATGIVASLGHPGGNITGSGSFTPELAGKNIEVLRELLPSATRLAALCNQTDNFTKVFLEQVHDAAAKQRFDLNVVMTDPAGIEAAFARIRSAGADAVIVQPSLPTPLCARLALDARLPAFSPQESFARVGGLFAYAGFAADQFERAATYVDKVLKGSKPADLPIELPTRFDLSINNKTAQALGLTVPQAMLARAGTLIE
jgi:putative ABC transport system substrate-binding protein